VVITHLVELPPRYSLAGSAKHWVTITSIALAQPGRNCPSDDFEHALGLNLAGTAHAEGRLRARVGLSLAGGVITTHTHIHDVQCINPLSPSHISGHASNTATILKRAALAKTAKYQTAAEALNATFVPFIVTAQCDIGKEALDLLAVLQDL
jgi:hypothetical protein